MHLLLFALLAHAAPLSEEYKAWYTGREAAVKEKCAEAELLSLKEQVGQCQRKKSCRGGLQARELGKNFSAKKTEYVKCVKATDAAYEKEHPKPAQTKK